MTAYKDKERGTWYTTFRYTDWTGNIKQAKKRGFSKKSEALKYEHEFIKQQQGSTDITFQSLYDMYIKDCETRIRYTTLDKKKQIFEAKILPYFKDIKVRDITPQIIRKWQNTVIAKHKAPTYIKKINDQVMIIFNFATKYFNLPNNPAKVCGNIGKLKTENPMLFWTKEEFNLFMTTFEDNPIAKITFEMLFYTGLRIGEFSALTLNDIDFDSKILHVTKTFIRLHKKDITSPPKTQKSKRDIAMPDFLLEHLKTYVSHLYGYDSKDRLFLFTESFIRYRILEGCKKTGVKRIRIHDIRHSHASLLIEMGFSPILIAERLGHENIQTTLNTYSHLYPNKQSEISVALEKLKTEENLINVAKMLP